jgi:hypothetical protein
LHGSARVETDGVEHRRVKGITDSDEQFALFEIDRQDGILKSDLGRDFFACCLRDGGFGKVNVRPFEGGGQLLEKNVFCHAAFAANKGQQRFLGTVLGGYTPRLVPLVELLGSHQGDLRKKVFDR